MREEKKESPRFEIQMTSPINIIIGILFVLAIAALVLCSRKYVGAKYESEYKSKYESKYDSGQKAQYAKYNPHYSAARESSITAYPPRPSNDTNDVVIQFPTQQQATVGNANTNPNSSFSSSSSTDANGSASDDKQVRFGVEQVRVFSKDNPEFLVDYEATRVKSKDASLDLKDPRYQERLRSQVPLLEPLIFQPQVSLASSFTSFPMSSMSWSR